MDENARLQAWLAKGATTHPLDEFNKRQTEVEGINALLAQQEQYRKVVRHLKNRPCVCSSKYVIRCPYHLPK